MIIPLETKVEAIPSDTVSGFDPALLVFATMEGASTVDQYRRFSRAPSTCLKRGPLVAIISTEVLNTPDQVSMADGRRDGNCFKMRIEIRRFEGAIDANDPWIALVRMELGTLEPGTYQLVVKEVVFSFTELRHPERAKNLTTSERCMSFNCV